MILAEIVCQKSFTYIFLNFHGNAQREIEFLLPATVACHIVDRQQTIQATDESIGTNIKELKGTANNWSAIPYPLHRHCVHVV